MYQKLFLHHTACEGDVTVFGSNAGSQYVAMILTVTLYNYPVLKIQASLDLVKIMKIGNELYSQESVVS